MTLHYFYNTPKYNVKTKLIGETSVAYRYPKEIAKSSGKVICVDRYPVQKYRKIR